MLKIHDLTFNEPERFTTLLGKLHTPETVRKLCPSLHFHLFCIGMHNVILNILQCSESLEDIVRQISYIQPVTLYIFNC